jgi:hypothetical protein
MRLVLFFINNIWFAVNVSLASALILHWFGCSGYGLHRVLSYFEESFHGQQTLRGQPALFFP